MARRKGRLIEHWSYLPLYKRLYVVVYVYAMIHKAAWRRICAACCGLVGALVALSIVVGSCEVVLGIAAMTASAGIISGLVSYARLASGYPVALSVVVTLVASIPARLLYQAAYVEIGWVLAWVLCSAMAVSTSLIMMAARAVLFRTDKIVS